MSTTAKFPISLSEALGLAGVGSLTYTILSNSPVAKFTALAVAISLFVMLSFALVSYRLWNARENSFRFLDSDHGEAADSPVKEAKHLIQTTHFTSIVPYEPYIALIKNKIAEGVKVKRIVARDPNEPLAKYEWLNTFSDSTNYAQVDVEPLFPLPLDIMIFDHKTVVLHLPSDAAGDDFHSAILIDNEKVARLFGNMFTRVEIRARHQNVSRIDRPKDQ